MRKGNAGHRRARIVARRGNHLRVCQTHFPADFRQQFPQNRAGLHDGREFLQVEASAEASSGDQRSGTHIQQLGGAGFRILLRRQRPSSRYWKYSGRVNQRGRPLPLVGKFLQVRGQLVDRY